MTVISCKLQEIIVAHTEQQTLYRITLEMIDKTQMYYNHLGVTNLETTPNANKNRVDHPSISIYYNDL